jgi:hypothetical protein
MLAMVSVVGAQSSTTFAAGEGQRVYDLLDDLGCIGNIDCTALGDFTPTTACDYRNEDMRCDSSGRLAYL